MEEKEQRLIRMEDGKLIISKRMIIDPNKDGEPLAEFDITIKLHLAELPDELYDAWKNRKKKD